MEGANVIAVKIVGMVEVADALGVKLRTVHQWRYRGIFPPPDLTLGHRPAWNLTTIIKWAKDTGRKVAS